MASSDSIPEQKSYPHFDKQLSRSELELILSSPDRVATNPFFPFLSYDKSFQPFRKKADGRPSKKVRPIAYASRRDAVIFEHYRNLLSKRYEQALNERGISDVPVAYRKIPRSDGRGKCNIDFAKDAFDKIIELRRARVYVIDISSYFPSICHSKLKEIWCELIEKECLPDDHFAVYRAITRYSTIDRTRLYKKLKIIGTSGSGKAKRTGFLVRREEMPRQVCSPETLREIIAETSNAGEPILWRNKKPFGIPQGAPISDVLANMNLIDFDSEMSSYVSKLDGVYRRYSDDMIFIFPSDKKPKNLLGKLRDELVLNGSELRIKRSKVSVVDYDLDSSVPFKARTKENGKNGLEYLGFRFDGRNVYLRDRTVSNFYRKIALGAKAFVHSQVSRYTGKSNAFVSSKIRLGDFLRQYGRVEDFERVDTYRQWTFWTYVRRARQIFGPISRPINNQVKGYKKFAKERMSDAKIKAGLF